MQVAGRSAVLLGQGRRPEPATSAIREVDSLNQALMNASRLLEQERASRHSAESERRVLLQKETEALEAAQTQNKAKDKFLAMLGHELRNPLAAISGAVSLLKTGVADQARLDRSLEIIDRQYRHLNYIVDDLLDVSRLLAGKIVLNNQPLDLCESVSASIDGIRGTDRALGFNISFTSRPVWVNADPVRIEQILNNLANNALKFSPVGGAVRIGLAEENGRAVVTVQDEGSGISEDLLPHIFEPFVQGPAPLNHTHAGLGVSLALVRELVELHGGEVHATSAGQGRGSVFTVGLPAIWKPAGARSAPELKKAPARRKLVYVEDNADARSTMTELLTMMAQTGGRFRSGTQDRRITGAGR